MKQSLKLKDAGSLVNLLMANNQTIPVVGEGATILYYSDRRAYDVISVSDDYKKVVIERDGNQKTIVYRNGAWRQECKELWLTEAGLNLPMNDRIALCALRVNNPLGVTEGLTFIKTSYPKINIIFGISENYTDPSF